MTRRPLFLPCVVLLLGCLAALPACKKKKTDSGGGDEPNPSPGTPPAAVSSDYLVYAHVNVKQVVENPLVNEIKNAFVKNGGEAEWDKVQGEVAEKFGGVKPTDIDSVTACVPDFPTQGEPGFVLIVTAAKPFNKAKIEGIGPQARPDARGFYSPGKGEKVYFHFPDDKTLVVLHEDLAAKYLAGYGKDRSGWPMTPELRKAAAGHTLFVAANLGKVPPQLLNQAGMAEQVGPLLAARAVTLTADLKGKQLSVAGRATFPDAAAAGKAKETVEQFIKMGVGLIDMVQKKKNSDDIGPFMPAVTEARRALAEAKVEVSGSDLTVAGSYKADFDVGAMLVDAVQKVRGAAGRMKASNNLKQIVLASINYADTNNGMMPIYGADARGLPIKNSTEKPLLSWRVAILPYIEQDNLYKQFKLNEPWDSPNNKKLIDKMPAVFAPVAKPGKPGYTHMQMVVGPNAMQPGMRYPASITDGTSNTLAVVEAADPVIWTKPDDIMLTGKETPADIRKKIGGEFPGGFLVAMWDGSVRFVANSVSDQTLKGVLSPNGGEVPGSDW